MSHRPPAPPSTGSLRLSPPVRRRYVTVATLCAGAVLSHVGVAGQQPHADSQLLIGEACMLVAVLAAACKYVFAKASIERWRTAIGSASLLLWIELMIFPVLLVWSHLAGELALFAEYITHGPVSRPIWLCSAAALGGFRFFCELLVLRFWSATTLSATNLAAHSLIVVASVIITDDVPVTTPLILGCALTIAASTVYGYTKLTKRVALEENGAAAGGASAADGGTGGGVAMGNTSGQNSAFRNSARTGSGNLPSPPAKSAG